MTQSIVIRIKKGADGLYAAETVLGHRKGFYGLVAAGWDLTDFGTPWPRGRIPSDANLSELIVGFFDRERATSQIGTAEELNDHLVTFCAENNLPAPARITEDDLTRVRQIRGSTLPVSASYLLV